MKYRIEKIDMFFYYRKGNTASRLTKKKLRISTAFWKQFNQSLKKAYLLQFRNWTKYAFTQRRNGLLFYACGIPQKGIIPDDFVSMEIPTSKYLVFEHRGAMNQIYDTYNTIYKEVLPLSGYSLKQDEFLHFEKYDRRFNWNSSNSVIEIWIPIR